jgi:two-component system, OmpR family, phosphate regulon sensor histidine kinase PhoR
MTNQYADLLHTFVHEFQTPIANIRMAADILASPIGHAELGRSEKYLQIIREETERLQQQVETVLSLARAEQNALIVCLDEVNLHNLIKSVAQRHETYLTLNLQVNQPIVFADRHHLTNVLHNLLDNAVKYSLDSPKITITTAINAAGQLVLSVRDQGVGIPKTAQAQIFKPYFRVQSHEAVSVKGFGLGLSYVQKIVEAHDWQIFVVSEVGQGSEFSIELPLNLE